jgi:hypothetical protein
MDELIWTREELRVLANILEKEIDRVRPMEVHSLSMGLHPTHLTDRLRVARAMLDKVRARLVWVNLEG